MHFYYILTSLPSYFFFIEDICIFTAFFCEYIFGYTIADIFNVRKRQFTFLILGLKFLVECMFQLESPDGSTIVTALYHYLLITLYTIMNWINWFLALIFQSFFFFYRVFYTYISS